MAGDAVVAQVVAVDREDGVEAALLALAQPLRRLGPSRRRRRRVMVGIGHGVVGVGVGAGAVTGGRVAVEELGHVIADVEPLAARVVRVGRGAHVDGRDADGLALVDRLLEGVELDRAPLDEFAIEGELLLLEGENDAREHLLLPAAAMDARRHGVVGLVAARLEHVDVCVVDGRRRGVGGACARGGRAGVGGEHRADARHVRD